MNIGSAKIAMESMLKVYDEKINDIKRERSRLYILFSLRKRKYKSKANKK